MSAGIDSCAACVHPWHRHLRLLQRLQDAVFAQNVVCRWQQRSARWAPQHPRSAVEMHQVNLVGMAERDVLSTKPARIAEAVVADEALEPAGVNRRRRTGLFGIDIGHSADPMFERARNASGIQALRLYRLARKGSKPESPPPAASDNWAGRCCEAGTDCARTDSDRPTRCRQA